MKSAPAMLNIGGLGSGGSELGLIGVTQRTFCEAFIWGYWCNAKTRVFLLFPYPDIVN